MTSTTPDPGPPSRASRAVVGGLALAVGLGGLLGLWILVWILMLTGMPVWVIATVLVVVCAGVSVAIRQVRRSAVR